MQVYFENDRLRCQVSSERELKKKYGADVAKKVKTRMLQLESAENLEELCSLPGNWKPLKHGMKNLYSARLSKKVRLIVRPDHPKIKGDGSIDRRQVKSITVMGIENKKKNTGRNIPSDAR